MGDVDDGRARRDPGDDRVTHAHELIPQAKVRDEDDRLAHPLLPRDKDLATVRRDGAGVEGAHGGRQYWDRNGNRERARDRKRCVSDRCTPP